MIWEVAGCISYLGFGFVRRVGQGSGPAHEFGLNLTGVAPSYGLIQMDWTGLEEHLQWFCNFGNAIAIIFILFDNIILLIEYCFSYTNLFFSP